MRDVTHNLSIISSPCLDEILVHGVDPSRRAYFEVFRSTFKSFIFMNLMLIFLPFAEQCIILYR